MENCETKMRGNLNVVGLCAYVCVFTLPVATVMAALILDTEVKDNVTDGGTSTWYCPDNWVSYSGDTEISCFRLEKVARSYTAAASHCQSLGGLLATYNNERKEAFIAALTKKEDGGEYWIGLTKEPGYESPLLWHLRDGTSSVYTEQFPSRITDYLGYNPQCAFISENQELDLDNDCQAEYFAICEKEISCTPGTFGNKCEKHCHCVGEPCDPRHELGPKGVTCKWGCQRNWMGAACDIEKQDPEVKYFCINSDGGKSKFVSIRIYTKGVNYGAIYGLTSNNARGSWCQGTTNQTLGHPHYVVTIQIPVNDVNIEEMASGKCAGKRVNETTFTWEIAIKEMDGILLEQDTLTSITCDFSQADNLLRTDSYVIEGEPRDIRHKINYPESSIDDVRFEIVDAYSGETVNEASFGTTVALRMTYGLINGSLINGVFPYNCVASTPDGKHIKQLLDQDGCQLPDSPLQPFQRSGDRYLETPFFNLFVFEDEQSVSFTCSFHLCFGPDCHVGCQRQLRQKRDAQDSDNQTSSTRSIRVLPSIQAQKPSGDNPTHDRQPSPPQAPAGYDIGAFVYLNPVTCTLFLLILLIFLCMYIAFLRTLRKAIYDIRKEIEVKRSRDKFLHCGCVQQKDRDYIVP